MQQKQTLLSLLGFTFLLTMPATAATLELKTLPAIPRSTATPNCPQMIKVTENSFPQEGGFSLEGQANLTDLATNIQFDSSQRFSVTWKGDLKPQYQNCVGTAKISSFDGAAFEGNSYLRARYEQGKVFFTLDMVGNRDANNYTTEILYQNISNGNPSWRWGGSD